MFFQKKNLIARSVLQLDPRASFLLSPPEKAICQGKLYPIQDIHKYHFIGIHRGDQIHSHLALLD